MKLRTTTPASISFIAKVLLVVAVVVMALAIPIQIGSTVFANDYDEKIKALQQDINKYQAEADRLNTQATTLQSTLAQLANQKAAIQAQIDLSQAKYDQLVIDIANTEKKIADNQNALGETIADLYVDEKISPLEMLASSKNISEYLDKQEYRNSIRDELVKTITTVKDLKAELDIQKIDAEKVLDEQKIQRQSLIAKENENQAILTTTQGQEASYLQLVTSTTEQLKAVHAEQQAAFARLTNNGANNAGAVGAFQFRNFSGNQNCGGGYPYCASQDSMTDPWGLYNRECVSWSAWRATQAGKRVGNFSGKGNAYEWPSSASGWMGATVNNTPAVNAVAILPRTPGFAPLGHSMNVEAILEDGWLRVSQYNFGGTGQYSTMDIQSSGVVFIHFPNK